MLGSYGQSHPTTKETSVTSVTPQKITRRQGLTDAREDDCDVGLVCWSSRSGEGLQCVASAILAPVYAASRCSLISTS